MNSKNITADDGAWMAMIKSLPCVVCIPDSEYITGITIYSGQSIAHHVEQGDHFTTLPVCESCHVGPRNGIHGQRFMWKLMKKTEVSCLNTLFRFVAKNYALLFPQGKLR